MYVQCFHNNGSHLYQHYINKIINLNYLKLLVNRYRHGPDLGVVESIKSYFIRMGLITLFLHITYNLRIKHSLSRNDGDQNKEH